MVALFLQVKMPKITQNNLANQKPPAGPKPNIPPEGILKSPEKEDDRLKKWRGIILNAIRPKVPQKETQKFSPKIKMPGSKEFPEKQDSQEPPKKIKKIYLRIIGYGFLGLIFVLITLSFFVYSPANKNKTIRQITEFVPYPAAIIKTPCGYRSVSIATFDFDLKAINHFYEQKKSADENYQIPQETQIILDVYTKELKNKLLECSAQKNKINVSEEELEREVEKTIVQAGNKKTLENIIRNLYDWDLITFQKKVLYYYILENKMAEILNKDPEINSQALEKISEIEKKVKENPENFYKIAQKYSEDTETNYRGGDLNWVKKGQLDQTLEQAAFTLKVGDISQILQTNAGYHLIKITDKKTTPEGVEQVRLSHILIKTRALEDWLEEKLRQSEIYKFYY